MLAVAQHNPKTHPADFVPLVPELRGHKLYIGDVAVHATLVSTARLGRRFMFGRANRIDRAGGVAEIVSEHPGGAVRLTAKPVQTPSRTFYKITASGDVPAGMRLVLHFHDIGKVDDAADLKDEDGKPTRRLRARRASIDWSDIENMLGDAYAACRVDRNRTGRVAVTLPEGVSYADPSITLDWQASYALVTAETYKIKVEVQGITELYLLDGDDPNTNVLNAYGVGFVACRAGRSFNSDSLASLQLLESSSARVLFFSGRANEADANINYFLDGNKRGEGWQRLCCYPDRFILTGSYKIMSSNWAAHCFPFYGYWDWSFVAASDECYRWSSDDGWAAQSYSGVESDADADQMEQQDFDGHNQIVMMTPCAVSDGENLSCLESDGWKFRTWNHWATNAQLIPFSRIGSGLVTTGIRLTQSTKFNFIAGSEASGYPAQAAQEALRDDYRAPDTPTMDTGTFDGFSVAEDAYTFTASAGRAKFTLHGSGTTRKMPVFVVSSYSDAAVLVRKDGSLLTEGTDYIQAKPDGTTLVVQLLADVTTDAEIEIAAAFGTNRRLLRIDTSDFSPLLESEDSGMITQVTPSSNYVHVAVGCTDSSGTATDPTAAEAWFYKVSPADGSLSLDSNIDGDGKVTLTKQGGQTGFYGAAVAIQSLSPAEYVVLFKATIDGTSTLALGYFSLIPERDRYEARAAIGYDNSAQSAHLAAWLLENGQNVAAPTSCTIRIYDQDGNEVFNVTSSSPDARGIFRMTQAAPGLAADTVYEARVAIVYDAVTYETTVGVATIR